MFLEGGRIFPPFLRPAFVKNAAPGNLHSAFKALKTSQIIIRYNSFLNDVYGNSAALVPFYGLKVHI